MTLVTYCLGFRACGGNVVTHLKGFNVFATPVNINTADAETISSSLKGIGLKKAQAILEFRKANGEFKTHEDVAKVKGIGDKTIEKNKKDILFKDPK